MKRIIVFFGTAFVAAAFGAPAAGAEPTKILPEPTEAAPLTDVVNQPVAGHILATGGLEIKCKDGTGTQSWTSANFGTTNINLAECTSALGETCTSEGANEGNIVLLGSMRFWLARLMTNAKEEEEKGVLVAALVFLVNEFKVLCINKGKTVKSEDLGKKGCVAGLVEAESLNKLISKAINVFAQWTPGGELRSGEQQILLILPQESTELMSCLLKVTVNGGAEQLAALLFVFEIEKYKKGGSNITIELMNP
jgi:hypothetical protein